MFSLFSKDMQRKENIILARYSIVLSILSICFVDNASCRPGNNEPTDFFTGSDEKFDEEHIQVNVSRGVMHLLTRVDKLNAELCESKTQVVRLEEQIESFKQLKNIERENCELKLAQSKANSTSEMNIMIARHENEFLQIEKRRTILCHEAGKGLQRMNLSSGVYFFSGNMRKNWFGALKYCRSHGLDLLALDSEFENNVIIEKTKQIGIELKDSIWTSGTDQENSRVWYWATTGSNIEFTDWHINQPDSVKQQCLKIWHISDKIHWDDGSCLSKFRFFCELPAYCLN